MSLRQKVSSAIRILRWNRDVSARASHLVEVFNFQAGSGNVSDSTFSERKNMSTKTSFKRVALVAVAALSLGGISAVSAHAYTVSDLSPLIATTVASDVVASSSTSKSTTLTQTASTGGYVEFQGIANDVTSGLSAITLTATGSTWAKASTASSPWLSNVDSLTTGAALGSTVSGAGTATASVAGGTLLHPSRPANTVAAPGTSVNDATFRLATTAAGTYTVSVDELVTLSGVSATNHLWTFTVIVGAGSVGAVTSTSISTAATAPGYYNAVEGIAYGPKAQTNSAIATYTVTELAGSSAASTANTQALTATILGVGSFSGNVVGAQYVAYPAATITSGVQAISVYGDGREGVSTVTFAVNGVTVATKTVKFYGNVVKLVATGIMTVGKASSAGATLGAADYLLGGVTETAGTLAAQDGTASAPVAPSVNNDPAISVLATDSTGTPVPAAITATVSDGAVVSSGKTTDLLDSGAGAYSVGTYVHHITWTSAPVGKSGATATITYSLITSAGVVVSSNPISVSLGGSAATITMTADATDYAPAAGGTITVTAKDSSGNPAYDEAALFSKVVESTSLFGGKRPTAAAATTSGKATYAFYAPAVSGTFHITATLASDGVTTLDLPIVVTNDAATVASQAATDAAQEATDAANAAYDAANNAMDSADAATAAAQDAADNASAALAAVTSLSATVAKLVKSVAAIAAALAKVQKKIGA